MKKKRLVIVAGVALALCLIAAGFFSITVNSAERKLAKQLKLGQRYLDEMNYEQAIAAYEHAISIDPKCVDAYHGMAVAYAGMGEYENSLDNFDKMLALDGENEQVPDDLDGYLIEYIGVLIRDRQYYKIEILYGKYGKLVMSEELRYLLEAKESGEADIPTNEEEIAEMTDAEQIQVTVKRTEIQADSVYNLEGYGALTIQGAGSPSEKALLDANGNFVFPYQSTFLSYRISDGVVSLTESSAYSLSGGQLYWDACLPAYYNLDGSSVFAPEATVDETDWGSDGVEHIYRTTWLGGPMMDGYALVIEVVEKLVHRVGGSTAWREYHSYIIDKSGAITCILPEEYNELREDWMVSAYTLGWCGEGLFAVFENGRDGGGNFSLCEAKGYMDPTGNMVLDLSGRGFVNLGSFHEGLAYVWSENGMLGFIDKTGALVIPCIYDSIYGSFSKDGICAVKKDDKWGYIDRNGSEVIPFEYDSISGSFFSEDGICAVKKDDKWGYIDRDGGEVIPFEYDGAYGAGAGLASVVKGGKCGLVDYSNQVIVPLEYDDISSCKSGTAYAIKEGYIYIIDVTVKPESQSR